MVSYLADIDASCSSHLKKNVWLCVRPSRYSPGFNTWWKLQRNKTMHTKRYIRYAQYTIFPLSMPNVINGFYIWHFIRQSGLFHIRSGSRFKTPYIKTVFIRIPQTYYNNNRIDEFGNQCDVFCSYFSTPFFFTVQCKFLAEWMFTSCKTVTPCKGKKIRWFPWT